LGIGSPQRRTAEGHLARPRPGAREGPREIFFDFPRNFFRSPGSGYLFPAEAPARPAPSPEGSPAPPGRLPSPAISPASGPLRLPPELTGGRPFPLHVRAGPPPGGSPPPSVPRTVTRRSRPPPSGTLRPPPGPARLPVPAETIPLPGLSGFTPELPGPPSPMKRSTFRTEHPEAAAVQGARPSFSGLSGFLPGLPCPVRPPSRPSRAPGLPRQPRQGRHLPSPAGRASLTRVLPYEN
jgi:hypothetical protein